MPIKVHVSNYAVTTATTFVASIDVVYDPVSGFGIAPAMAAEPDRYDISLVWNPADFEYTGPTSPPSPAAAAPQKFASVGSGYSQIVWRGVLVKLTKVTVTAPFRCRSKKAFGPLIGFAHKASEDLRTAPSVATTPFRHSDVHVCVVAENTEVGTDDRESGKV
jgi:hypothetical protein